MTAQEFYKSGDLRSAVTSALDEVKKNPTDVGKRCFLAELLCFSGDLERADRQLAAIEAKEPELMMDITMFRQLICGEQARQEFYSKGRMPSFLNDDISPDMKLHLEAAVQMRSGATAEAAALLGKAQESQRPVPGTCDGKAFDDLRDLDDLTSSFFEILTSKGEYFWIPISQVESIDFRAMSRPRDLLWRCAHMIVRGGTDGDVFLPVLYAGAAQHQNDQVRLGRATEWLGDAGAPVRGVGQRIFLIGEEDRSILELKKLKFAD